MFGTGTGVASPLGPPGKVPGGGPGLLGGVLAKAGGNRAPRGRLGGGPGQVLRASLGGD